MTARSALENGVLLGMAQADTVGGIAGVIVMVIVQRWLPLLGFAAVAAVGLWVWRSYGFALTPPAASVRSSRTGDQK